MKDGKNRKGVCISLFLGACGSLYVQLGAYLAFGEVICIMLIPVFYLTGAYARLNKTHIVTAILYAVWLLGAIGSDLYRGSPLDLALRGWGQVTMFGAGYIACLGLLQKGLFRVDWFMVGMTISKAVNILGMRPGNIDSRTADDFAYASWKLVYGSVVDCGVIVIAAMLFEKRPKLTCALIATAGVLNILMGARSMGGIELVAAVSALIIRQSAKVNREGRPIISSKQQAVFGLAILVLGVGLYHAYFRFAKIGAFGVEAQQKSLAESEGRYGAIMTSRAQLLGGVLAIYNSPLIGYGSWALDWEGFGRQAAEIVGIGWRDDARNTLGVNRIPSHSYLVEFWVEHGLLGALFWFWAAYHILRLIVTSGRGGAREIAFGMLLLCSLSWNLLFSPLGDRLMIAAWLLYVTSGTDDRRRLLGLPVFAGNVVSRGRLT